MAPADGPATEDPVDDACGGDAAMEVDADDDSELPGDAAGEAVAGEGVDGPVPGPPAVSIQFRFGAQLFKRTDVVQCGRYIYKARGTLDGRGGLTLCYSSDRLGGCWEVGSPSGGCLYFKESDAMTPTALVGNLPWARVPKGECFLTIMQSAADAEVGGWLDPPLVGPAAVESSA